MQVENTVRIADAAPTRRRSPGGRVRRGMAFAAALVVGAAAAFGALPANAATQTGFRAHAYAGFDAEAGGGAITGQKPESKLWYHAGDWWAAMLSPAANGGHTIWKLAGTGWEDTGVLIDQRAVSREDVLSLGSTLYIVSRAAGTSGTNKLRRFTFANGAYVLEAGFPVDVPGAGKETTVLARDSTGILWLTFTSAGTVFVARSNSDTSWGAAFALPVGSAGQVSADDISSVISFTDATGPAVGVMWTNQNTSADYFAVHRDGAADSAWSVETALSGSREADDHINLKTAEGRVYAAVKTSQSRSNKTLIKLLVRSTAGSWSQNPVALVREGNTRPIAILELDPVDRRIYVFFTLGEGPSAHGIAYKSSPMDGGIGFPSSATTFIEGANAERIDNATTMKANADAASGVVVMASDGNAYWWNKIAGGGPPPNTSPTANASSETTSENTATPVTLSGSDPETCELTFAIGSAPAHGTLGGIANHACVPGTPNADTATVTYTPAAGYTGGDSFTYTTSDGTATSPAATVSITVTGSAPGQITFRSSSSGANAKVASLSIPVPSGVQQGDVMVAAVSARGTPAFTAPPGWVFVRQDIANTTAIRQAIYYKVAGASESGPYTWTLSSAQNAAGGIVAYSGVNGVNPIDVHSGAPSAATSAAIVAPSVTTTAAGDVVVGFFTSAINGSIAPPAGMTERFEALSNQGSSFPDTTEASDQVQTAAGATGSRTATGSSSAWNIGQLVALRPGSGGSPNTAPTATASSANTNEESPITVTLRGADAETCELSFSIATPPAHGTLGPIGSQTCVPGGSNADTASVTYTPAGDYAGPDSFTFSASDGTLTSSPATISLTVNPVNDIPTAASASLSTTEATSATASMSGTDVETCNLTFAIGTGPAHGTLGGIANHACVPGSPNADSATVTYTPAAGYTGGDSFTYTTSDGTATSPAATVSITVTGSAPGQITFRSSSSGANANVASLSIPVPSGVQQGDVMVAAVSARGNPTFTPPAGWFFVRLDANGFTIRQSIYYKVAGASETGPYTWTLSSAQNAAGGIVAYAGVDTANPIDAHGGGVSSSNATSIVAPSITTTTAGDMVVGFFTSAINGSIAPPAGMTERFDAVSNQGSTYPDTAEACDQLRPGSGATGTRTATGSSSGGNVGQMVALRPRVS